MINPDDAAFPIVQNGTIAAPGLTIRQEFAKAAMMGFIAQGQSGQDYTLRVARMSCSVADALIAELNKKEGV